MPFGGSNRKRTPIADEPALYEYAVQALSRRMRTVAELKRLMRTRVPEGLAGEALMNAVVDRLKQERYLDDTRYAAEFTRLRQDNEKFGKRRVRMELAARGVHPELANRAIGEAYEDVNEERLARQFLQRRRVQQPSSEKETGRVVRMMLRAGYSSGVIARILRAWDVDVDETTLAAAEPDAPDAEA